MEPGTGRGPEAADVRPAYRGRLAPTPTGYLHAGHAATFGLAAERAIASGGSLLLRIEDLDPARCRKEFVDAAIEDLEWLGLRWDEGPVFQSRRRERYLAAWRRLRDGGWIYPCSRSRKDVAAAVSAPHVEEPVFPVEWRMPVERAGDWAEPAGINWRFRVPDGPPIVFTDGRCGLIERTPLRDFGDFVVWNRDDVPAYELAVVVDDLADGITEIVRGEDLLTSTARQILLARALDGTLPATWHGPLIKGPDGQRLAKRSGGFELRTLRARGLTAADVFAAVRNGRLP